MARKYSGPLQPGKRSAYVKGARKNKKGNKTGLNKVEKQQVQNIINKNLETKYFHTTEMDSLRELAPHPIQTGAAMYCLGFATNTNLIRTGSNDAFPIKYGSNTPMGSLHLARLFTNETAGATENQKAYALDGDDLRVSFAKSRWLLERTAVDTTPGVGEQTLDALPMLVRMVRICPKALKGSFQWPNPEEDLFLDQYAQPIGIKRVGFRKDDIALYKVNNRRYNVIQDKMFTLLPPCTTSTFDIAAGNTQVTNVSNNSKKFINMDHNIGQKFHYNREGFEQAHSYPETPATGMKTEYVLFHFQLLGDDTVVGRRSADDVRITCCPVSGFKDA